jgi:hypothetical protein
MLRRNNHQKARDCFKSYTSACFANGRKGVVMVCLDPILRMGPWNRAQGFYCCILSSDNTAKRATCWSSWNRTGEFSITPTRRLSNKCHIQNTCKILWSWLSRLNCNFISENFKSEQFKFLDNILSWNNFKQYTIGGFHFGDSEECRLLG